MASKGVSFGGSIPSVYDRYLSALLFEPYAQDLVARAVLFRPECVLETAAGTGILTELLIRSLPDAAIAATDLSREMIDIAASKTSSVRAQFATADAQDLPFADDSFDLVVCQFGMMFLPDRSAGYREAKRVLRSGGHLLFNVWDTLARNVATRIVADAVGKLWAENPPTFFNRVPFGYCDTSVIKNEVTNAGFADFTIETVCKIGSARSSRDAAVGLCHGTPLRTEIEARGDLEGATLAATEALAATFGWGAIEAPMSAHVICATS